MDIPSGWNSFHLKDVTYESRIRAASEDATQLVVFGVNNQTGLSTDSKYHADKLDRYKIVKPGMFAYNPMRLNIGSIGYCNDSLDEGLVSPDYVVFGCKENKLDSKYFSHCVQEHHWKNWVERAGAGSVRVRIYYKDISLYPIILPPLPEQHKIAEILSTWDEAITKTEQLIVALERRKKGLMQRLLTGEVRFAGFDGEWREMQLGKVAKYIRGYSYKSSDYSETKTSFNFITLKCIGKGGGFQKDGLKYLQSDVDNKFHVQAGDLIFAITDITREGDVVGAPILVPPLDEQTKIVSMDLIKVELSSKIDKFFLYYLMQLPQIRNFFRSRASGSTVLHLDVNGTKKLTFIAPPTIEEQQKISQLLNSVDLELEMLKNYISKLNIQKKGLMQRLLTGQVRVKV